MKISSKDFRVPAGTQVSLGKWPTRVPPAYKSKKEYRKLLATHIEALSSLQALHYAADRRAVLIIFQGMDAAGKDGAIRHVMSGVNPQGCEVFSFKQPSAEELQHDFLWRSTCRLPDTRPWHGSRHWARGWHAPNAPAATGAKNGRNSKPA